MTTRQQIIDQAKSWLGLKESDGSFKVIIDTYNKGAKTKISYDTAWCAAFVSACAIACDATDIIPVTASCGTMITKLKKLGAWVEDDNYTPCAGDIIFYDWSDDGKGDDTTGHDHVGIVVKVEADKITATEGNKSNKVAYRTITQGRYIRGFGVPKYADDVIEDTPADAPQVKSEPKVVIKVVTASALRVHSKPDVLINTRIGLLPKGSAFEVDEVKGTMSHGRKGNLVGWVASEYLK